ncbi:uncharacterized protein [Mytilus edulis]|uniref:uncharacterized protein n=1 Tax=Mytilus edulis TaxID=6550 RepID=UPI0039EE4244
MLRGLLIFGILVQVTYCAVISSCPAYGCRPSGTFSYLIDIQSKEPEVFWNTTYGAIPDSLGCVGNLNNIVCPYKGPKSNGYVGIGSDNGNQMWYDTVLHDPSLPVMDIEGGIIGTDGHYMVKYEADGTQIKPSKPVDPSLFPLYSVQLSDNGMLVFASMNGVMFAMDTAGIPLASISFNGSVERFNGSFLPVSTPIIVGTRVYVLTEFRPDEDTPESRMPNILGMRRLYAVDIFLRMVDRLHTTWYFNFEREDPETKNSRLSKELKANEKDTTLRFKPRQPVQGNPLLMANIQEEVIYVILPPPETNGDEPPMFWAIKDDGDDASLLYKRTISASRMAMYEINGSLKHKSKSNIKTKSKLFDAISSKSVQEVAIPIWLLSESKSSIYKVNPTDGSIELTVNLTSVLEGVSEVTSDMMVSRSDDKGTDNVIFGITLKTSTITNYIMSLDSNGEMQWKVPTPSNVAVIGQIAGISSEGTNSDDMLVAFGNNKDSGSVFAIK